MQLADITQPQACERKEACVALEVVLDREPESKVARVGRTLLSDAFGLVVDFEVEFAFARP
jgi:hypothetical protein